MRFFIFSLSLIFSVTSYSITILHETPESVTLEEYNRLTSNNPVLISGGDLPHIYVNSDGGFELDYGEGRIAYLAYKKDHITDYNMSFNFSEFSCIADSLPQRCGVHSEIMYYQFRLIWKRHPDPTLINTQIMTTDPTNDLVPAENPINAFHFYDFYDSFKSYTQDQVILPEDQALVSSSSIQCDDESWFDYLVQHYPGERPNSTIVAQWSTEAMLTNLETGIGENMSFLNFLNVGIERTMDGQLVLSHIENYPFFTFFLPLFELMGGLTGGIVGWTFFDNASLCTASLNVDNSQSEMAIQQHLVGTTDSSADVEWLPANHIGKAQILGPLQFRFERLFSTHRFPEDSEIYNAVLMNLVVQESDRDTSIDVIMPDGTTEVRRFRHQSVTLRKLQ
jgi:hypothetical protein